MMDHVWFCKSWIVLIFRQTKSNWIKFKTKACGTLILPTGDVIVNENNQIIDWWEGKIVNFLLTDESKTNKSFCSNESINKKITDNNWEVTLLVSCFL